MIGKPITGRSFEGCVRYLVNRQEATILEAEGVRIQSARSITLDFNQQRKLNPALGKAVGHTILSWSAEDKEKLTDGTMAAVAKEYMEKMGIVDTQYLIVRHTDREHPHLHIVYNRVNNEGKTISDQNNYKRNVKACKELTQQYGYHLAPGKEKVNRQQLKGSDQLRYQIHDAVKDALKDALNWQDLEASLQQKEIGIHRKYKGDSGEVQGISFSKAGITFKGSAIDRSMSYANLDRQLRQQNSLQKQLKPNILRPVCMLVKTAGQANITGEINLHSTQLLKKQVKVYWVSCLSIMGKTICTIPLKRQIKGMKRRKSIN